MEDQSIQPHSPHPQAQTPNLGEGFHKNLRNSYVELKVSRAVYTGQCASCKKAFTSDTLVVAVDSPHFVLLHDKCVPFYPYDNSYPHPFPLSFYTQNSYFTRT
jgi:hypothetical protein